MIHASLEKKITAKNEEYIQDFAEIFVREIIEEALKLSSIDPAPEPYSDTNLQFQPINVKNSDSSLSVTSPRVKSMLNISRNVSESSCEFSLTSAQNQNNFLNEDLYTLPVDSIKNRKSKKQTSLEDKCLKPKAIRAFNAIKSSHTRNLIDLKYLLLNFYSSNGVRSKKIGSEHSAFTKYQCQNLPNRRHTTQFEPRNRNRNDYSRVRLMKTETELKTARKCNRMKRCTFLNIKNSVCGVFRSHKKLEDEMLGESTLNSFKDRSLPPLPLPVCCSCDNNYDNSSTGKSNNVPFEDENSAYDADVEFNYGNYADGCTKKNKTFDFASNIEKVKDCGWYWGPMSSESAEKLLATEKDGSFIVRDSSDDRYIFSLTFKLNSSIMHVRIEHGQGNFSFGNYTNFRSHTIVEFIENTVQHSKSGRYLFFQYRHPVEGPMEVQLLYPVSRFKRVQSLQHMCRFVILKSVRRDLISSLPLPKPLIEYLNSKDYYAEEKF